jgi:hypothetical protein
MARRAFSWRRLCELYGSSQLFELKTDRRPATEGTAAGRCAEPTLFATMSLRRERGTIGSRLQVASPRVLSRTATGMPDDRPFFGVATAFVRLAAHLPMILST